MRLIALNCAVIVATLQHANYASKVGACRHAGAYPYAGAYAGGALRPWVVPSRLAVLPTAPNIR